MASIFISHSSYDKPFARKLIESLEKEGHTCWIDEKQIQVGERIVGKIQEGLKNTDFIALLLSKSSTQSRWVEEEWATQYWEQVNTDKVKLLPVLIEECEIPGLLKGIKYADFTKGDDIGLTGLLMALGSTTSSEIKSPVVDHNYKKQQLTAFLSKVTANETKLSTCLSDGIALAANIENATLDDFCTQELIGWGKTRNADLDSNQPEYRKIYAVLSPFEIKETRGLRTVEEIFKHIISDAHGIETPMFLSESVPQLESQIEMYAGSTGFYSASHNMSHFNPDAPDNIPVYVYINPRSYKKALEGIKQELINLTLDAIKK